MPDADTPLEARLRRHLSRVADQQQPPRDLERRIIAEAEASRRPHGGAWRGTLLMLALVLVIVSLFTLVVGHQSPNVFSNISSGLGT